MSAFEILLPFAKQIVNEPLRKTVIGILDKFDEEMTPCPAALHYHHNYRGGLVAHTKEVTEYALAMAWVFPEVKKDILLAGALLHDVAKIFEYQLVSFFDGQELPKRYLLDSEFSGGKDVWVITDYGNLIHHINGSNAEFVAQASIQGVDRDLRDDVSHVILAHHGPIKDWGSPVAPQTLEALLVHQADMQSAGYGALKTLP